MPKATKKVTFGNSKKGVKIPLIPSFLGGSALGFCACLQFFGYFDPAWQKIHDPNAKWNVCFTPAQECADLILTEIDRAQTTILVQAYNLTAWPVVEALCAARKRGVVVRIIVDKTHNHIKQMNTLKKAGAAVRLDHKPAIAHNKIMIFDGQVVLTGSYNFSYSAEKRNTENIILVRSPDVAKLYEANWHDRHGHTKAWRASLLK
jgi:phospholipase D